MNSIASKIVSCPLIGVVSLFIICKIEVLFVFFLAILEWSRKLHSSHIIVVKVGLHTHLQSTLYKCYTYKC